MDLVTGAMGSLIPKLGELLKEEYKLQKGVRERVKSLSLELESAHAALRKVAEVPAEQLDEQVKLWAYDVRELSYDMEDVVDTFLVRVDGSESADQDMFQRLLEKMANLFKKGKVRHQISCAIKGIKKQLQEVADRRGRYGVDDIVAKPTATSIIDPRLSALYNDVTKLVGIDEARDELISILSSQSVVDVPRKKMKIVSVVGFGGLGKTTLAKVVYDKLKVDFECGAFVPVGRNPELKKIFKDILIGLDTMHYTTNLNMSVLDERQLIDELRKFLKDKRYLIVIDDIWDISSWKIIRYALYDNNLESRIITTTRNSDIAEQVGGSYKIKPLTRESSRILFYGRIFGSEDKCPQQFAEVSEKILKKCAGVPLAIITISSLLANKLRNITVWHEVCNSIGSGFRSNTDMNDMRKIISLSYYDLPSHIRTCLLYISMFPKDYEIRRDRLIWRWIAEDFVQCRKEGDSLFELGESYFNEIVNRSLIQPVHVDVEGRVSSCLVHDMVLDLICSLSREENFVTISDDIEQITHSGSKVRRLSIQKSAGATMKMSQLRSFSIFNPAINWMPSLSCFQILRVLDLERCNLKESGTVCLRHVGNLFHLRYLGLRRTSIGELPEDIGKLQLLQILDLMGNNIKELPSAVVRLRKLMCLYVDDKTRLPSGLRNLTSLEVLETTLTADKYSADIVKELGHLNQLRVLRIVFKVGEKGLDESLGKALVGALRNLQKMKDLVICGFGRRADLMQEGWVPPPYLRRFVFAISLAARLFRRADKGSFSTLPTWINHSSLSFLSYLEIDVNEVRQEDIQILGMLPTLCYLQLGVTASGIKERPMERFVVSTDAFPCARRCEFINFVTVPSMFPRGAMPRLEHLLFYLRPWDFSNGDFEFDDLAMGHLPSLESVEVLILRKPRDNEEEVIKVRKALRHTVDVHPNHPSIDVRTIRRSL